jgi:hypothetical protein
MTGSLCLSGPRAVCVDPCTGCTCNLLLLDVFLPAARLGWLVQALTLVGHVFVLWADDP